MFKLLDEVSTTVNDKLFALLLGPSGGGKSRAIGTLPGKIAYLHFGAERHGVGVSIAAGGQILPICIDTKKSGEARTADESYEYLMNCINPAALKEAGIEAVAIDGLYELEKVVRSCKSWKAACTSSQGKHNAFAEPAATMFMMDKVFSALRHAQDTQGVHVVCTCPLDVQEMGDMGEVSTAKPRLSGYSVAETCVQQFGDVMVIGKLTSSDGQQDHFFQTGTDVNRVSKDEHGKIKKFLNFTPRLQGAESLPAFIKADLKNLIALKTKA